ncbi:MAG: valine--tRNA ligase [Candidatus Harrisonbacteria bacterium]|nr:valine--tRNA ligase [Candidatus Harrisonbacteria bacterium]
MKELPSAYDPKSTESRIYELWEKSGYFNPNNLKKTKKPFSIQLPPPNVTGSLHMGHALNATISDILIRWHRARGYKAVWFPGTDHAGIATQNVVEKQLKKEGKSRFDLGREKFIERVWEWKNQYGNIIIDQLKKLGASCDWSRLRFTMDPQYAEWVKRAFSHYYEKGLIYRGKRVISWCVRCQTSLSDLEIEYQPEKAKLYYIKYPVGDSYITVATTRPETMLGDAAVAVNPEDKRYKNFIGKKATLPIQNREIPIVADEAVEMEFGTGAVKVTPAHDMLDAEIGERHKLPQRQVINERGKMTAEAGKEFAGLKVLEAREKVIEKLKALGLIEKTEELDHNLAVCYRCGGTIEPLLSDQWFLKMGELAKKTLKAVKSGKTKIIPKNFEKLLFQWLNPSTGEIKDWCISRQIWWGHRLPVWFHEPKCVPKKGHEGDVVKCKDMVVAAEASVCEHCDAKFIQSEDVLDTWFSSALWPFAGLSEKDQKDFYPSNVLITARDIINLWVARMIFSGLEFKGKVPFPEALIHATILTKEGKRMSKSLGTGIDPLMLIDKYGADATRFGIVWQAMGNQDIHWDETAAQAGKKFANKLWNIARFIQGRTEIFDKTPETKNLEDLNILKKLKALQKSTDKKIQNYEFGQALHEIYDFVWHDLADKYIEHAKSREDENAKITLGFILGETLKLLHPFMPFVTEELWQQIIGKNLLLVNGE